MASTIKRYNGTTWTTVADLDNLARSSDITALDARLDTLEAFNTALTTTGLTAGNAEMGPRDAPWETQARFGHKDATGNINGYLASADGSAEINVASGRTLSIYDHANGLIGSMAFGKANIAGMGIGASPPYGVAYASLWRAGAEGAGDYGLLLHAGSTILNAPTGGTMHLRRANNDLLSIGTDNIVSATGVVRATGNTDIGSNSIYFSTHGGGWFMQDSTWIRSTNQKNVWLSGGWYGCDGGITIGRGGVTDNNYRLDVNANGHIWGNLLVTGLVDGNNRLQSYWNNGGDVAWYSAHVMAYGTGDGTQQTKVGLHSPGAATGIRLIGGFGDIMTFVNQSNGACPVQSSNFQTVSTVRVKKDVQSLRPGRDTIPVELDPFSDTIGAPPDIMSLNVVKYRPKDPELEIVPTDPSGDYDTVDPKDPTTFESVPRTDFIGEQANRERLGLIAEEVQYVIPSAVWHEPDKLPRAILYDQITVALLDHVQQLTALVQTLQYRVTELEEHQ